MKKTLSILLLLLLLLPFSNAFAQGTGNITGTVTDSTGTPLFQANVFLKGSSFGTVTDIEGRFNLTRIPAGEYYLAVRYIGYKAKEIEVTIEENQTLKLDVELAAEKVIEGQYFVLYDQVLPWKQAINQQLTANNIKNVVLAGQIQLLPNDNTVTALSRLPGVSVMNEDQIVIRGIEAKMNQVLINGIQMPSNNLYDRSTGLGSVSINMLSGIEVIKTVTPDMDANAIGGVINLRLKEADRGFRVNTLVQGNYNSTDANTNNFKAWASISNRFLDDKLGVILQGNFEKTDGGNQSASLNYSMLGIDYRYTQPGKMPYIVNGASLSYDRNIVKNSGVSLILDYKLPNGKIFFQNTYAANFTDRRGNGVNLDFNNTTAVYTIDRDKFGKEMWLNSLQAENSFGDLKVEAGLSHSFSNQYTRIAYPSGIYTNFEDITVSKAPFGFLEDGTTRQTYRDFGQQMTFEKVYEIFDNLDPSSYNNATLEGQPRTTKHKFNQHLYTASLDLTMPVNISKDIIATFKSGGKFVRTVREVDFTTAFNASNDPDLYETVENYFPDRPRNEYNRLRFTDVMGSFERGENFLSDEYDFKNGFKHIINTDIYDAWLIESQKGWTPLLEQSKSNKDDYNGSESITAAYLMGTFNIFQKFTVLGGLRYERYNMKYNAELTVKTYNLYGSYPSEVGYYQNFPWHYNHVDRVDENIFPNLQIRYNAADWLDLRAAYTEGIARPDYLAIVPKIYLFVSGEQMEIGNPKLRPTTARNLDFITSIYNNEIGLFTVNAFYKELKDVSYNTSLLYGTIEAFTENDIFIPDSAFIDSYIGGNYPSRSTRVSVTYNNPNTGYVRGFELDWQTNFWYLPRPFNSLVLDLNYTRSSSNMEYRKIIPFSGIENRRMIYTVKDTVYNGRLLQHAKDILNVSLGFDYKGFSSRMSFNMRGNVLTNIGSRPEETSYTGNIYRWDLAVNQELPIKGFSVTLTGINIFHNSVKTYQDFKRSADAPVTSNLVNVYYVPTIWQLALRYNY